MRRTIALAALSVALVAALGGSVAGAQSVETVVLYTVEVDRGIPSTIEDFAEIVDRALNDSRGWDYRFERVTDGSAVLTFTLASDNRIDRICRGDAAAQGKSCGWDGQVIVNGKRWFQGSDAWGADRLNQWRAYVINHEVGHAFLRLMHDPCPVEGEPASVMQQQTESLQGCTANPWPNP